MARQSAVDPRRVISRVCFARHIQQHSALAQPSGGHAAAANPWPVQEPEEGSRRRRCVVCGYAAGLRCAVSCSPFRAGVLLVAGLLLLSGSAASAFELSLPPSRLRDPGPSALAWAVVSGAPLALGGCFRAFSRAGRLPLRPITAICSPSRRLAGRSVSMDTRMGGEGGSRGTDPTEDRLRKWKVRLVRRGCSNETPTTVDSTGHHDENSIQTGQG